MHQPAPHTAIRVLVACVHRYANECSFLSLLCHAGYASLMSLNILLFSAALQTEHTTDVSMHIVSVPGGLSPPGPLVSASAHWEEQ